MRARKGFTLVEMVVVMMIFTIVLAVAAPAFVRAGGSPDDEQPWNDFVVLLRSARALSVEKGVTVSLVLDPANGNYRADSTGPRGAGLIANGRLEIGSTFSIQADSLRVHYSFRPTGAAFADSVLVRTIGGTSLISVDRWSGEVIIESR